MTVSRDHHEADRQLHAAVSEIGRRFIAQLALLPVMATASVVLIEHLSHPPEDGDIGPIDWGGMWPRPTGMTLGLAAFGVGTSLSLFVATTLSHHRTPQSGPMDRAVALVAGRLTAGSCVLTAVACWALVPGGLAQGEIGIGPSVPAALCAVIATGLAALCQPPVDSLRLELFRTQGRLSRLRSSDHASEDAPTHPDRGWLSATLRMWRGYPWLPATACSALLSLSFSIGIAVVERDHLDALTVVLPFTSGWVVYSGWRLAAGRASRARSPRLGWADRQLGLWCTLSLGTTVALVVTLTFEHSWCALVTIGLFAFGPPLAWRILQSTRPVRSFTSLAFAREIGDQERLASRLTRQLATLVQRPTMPIRRQRPPRTRGESASARALRRRSHDTGPTRSMYGLHS